MNSKTVLLGFCLISCVVGCGTTPGDAAYRGGHSEQAADLYKNGADQGDGAAALKLGLMIDAGKASAEVYGSKSKWYLRSCELGGEAGCHNSGNAYEYGHDGLIKDYEKARVYYHLAAEKGFMQSQYNLGSMYSNRYFYNDVEGLKWMLLAQKSASSCSTVPLCKWVLEDPPGHKNKLMSRMTSAQMAQANNMANAWTPKQ